MSRRRNQDPNSDEYEPLTAEEQAERCWASLTQSNRPPEELIRVRDVIPGLPPPRYPSPSAGGWQPESYFAPDSGRRNAPSSSSRGQGYQQQQQQGYGGYQQQQGEGYETPYSAPSQQQGQFFTPAGGGGGDMFSDEKFLSQNLNAQGGGVQTTQEPPYQVVGGLDLPILVPQNTQQQQGGVQTTQPPYQVVGGLSLPIPAPQQQGAQQYGVQQPGSTLPMSIPAPQVPPQQAGRGRSQPRGRSRGGSRGRGTSRGRGRGREETEGPEEWTGYLDPDDLTGLYALARYLNPGREEQGLSQQAAQQQAAGPRRTVLTGGIPILDQVGRQPTPPTPRSPHFGAFPIHPHVLGLPWAQRPTRPEWQFWADDPRLLIKDGPQREQEVHADYIVRLKQQNQILGIKTKPWAPSPDEGGDWKARRKNIKLQERDHGKKLLNDPEYASRWWREKRERQAHNARIERRLLELVRERQAARGLQREPTPDPGEDSGEAMYYYAAEKNTKSKMLKRCTYCWDKGHACSLCEDPRPPCKRCAEAGKQCIRASGFRRIRGIGFTRLAGNSYLDRTRRDKQQVEERRAEIEANRGRPEGLRVERAPRPRSASPERLVPCGNCRRNGRQCNLGRPCYACVANNERGLCDAELRDQDFDPGEQEMDADDEDDEGALDQADWMWNHRPRRRPVLPPPNELQQQYQQRNRFKNQYNLATNAIPEIDRKHYDTFAQEDEALLGGRPTGFAAPQPARPRYPPPSRPRRRNDNSYFAEEDDDEPEEFPSPELRGTRPLVRNRPRLTMQQQHALEAWGRREMPTGLNGEEELSWRPQQEMENASATWGLPEQLYPPRPSQPLMNPFSARDMEERAQSNTAFTQPDFGFSPFQAAPGSPDAATREAIHNEPRDLERTHEFAQINIETAMGDAKLPNKDFLPGYEIYTRAQPDFMNKDFSVKCDEDVFWPANAVATGDLSLDNIPVICGKDAKACKTVLHEKPWGTCPECHDTQKAVSKTWKQWVIAHNISWICEMCKNDMKEKGEKPWEPWTNGLCACLYNLGITWLCHKHREDGYKRIRALTVRTDEWSKRYNNGLTLCLKCNAMPPDPKTHIWVCKACRTVVKEPGSE
ncbi:hypothetical protein G7Y89_g6023 [Cudoniella acicularis]|uniref:Uncharacterized protein n=1 Tax=Cudoniella acicularis TaxID=354080 RepID=A0A8H4RM47_9HELO|nr:hypothetical protein G7Y89_g6023 [Cudoniella acicularis]